MRGVEGQAAQTATLDGTEYPYDALIIGGDYIIEYDASGHLAAFETVPRSANGPGGGR